MAAQDQVANKKFIMCSAKLGTKPPITTSGTTSAKASTGPWLPLAAGMNRFVWNLKLPRRGQGRRQQERRTAPKGRSCCPRSLPSAAERGRRRADAELRCGQQPTRVRTSPADLAEQHTLLLRIHDQISPPRTQRSNRLRSVREQVAAWQTRAAETPAVATVASALLEKLAAIEGRR